jgi:hypothetical protein
MVWSCSNRGSYGELGMEHTSEPGGTHGSQEKDVTSHAQNKEDVGTGGWQISCWQMDHGIWSVWNNILPRMISRTLYASNHQEGMKRTLWLGSQRRTGCSQLKVHIGLRFTEV